MPKLTRTAQVGVFLFLTKDVASYPVFYVRVSSRLFFLCSLKINNKIRLQARVFILELWSQTRTAVQICSAQLGIMDRILFMKPCHYPNETEKGP
jgi:hypothetical protein